MAARCRRTRRGSAREWHAQAQAQAQSTQRFLDFAQQHGPAAMLKAVSGGQYLHPQGIGYGDSDDWKGMVAGQSLLACRQALKGLQGA